MNFFRLKRCFFKSARKDRLFTKKIKLCSIFLIAFFEGAKVYYSCFFGRAKQQDFKKNFHTPILPPKTSGDCLFSDTVPAIIFLLFALSNP